MDSFMGGGSLTNSRPKALSPNDAVEPLPSKLAVLIIELRLPTTMIHQRPFFQVSHLVCLLCQRTDELLPWQLPWELRKAGEGVKRDKGRQQGRNGLDKPVRDSFEAACLVLAVPR